MNRHHGGTKHSAAGLREVTDTPTREPEIVKTKQFQIVSMTPDEAILQSEILGHDFFVFENSLTGRSAVLYKRDDGDYGMIEQGD